MNYNILQDILSVKPTKLKKIFKWLINNKIIEKVKNYSVGYSSSLYKLHPLVENMPIDTLSLSSTESGLVKKMKEHRNSFSMPCVITDHQFDLMSRINLSAAGREYLEKRYMDLLDWGELEYAVADPRHYDLLCFYLNDTYCRRNRNTHRVYSSVTSMPGRYRDFLEFEGLTLYQIDLKNAQILLSVSKIIEEFRAEYGDIEPLTTDIRDFKHLAETGKFYEYMANRIGVDITNEKLRSKFKEMFFKEIFYSKNSNRATQLKHAFNLAFPTVAAIIRHIKRHDYRQFAIQLQRLEASIFIDEVLRELYSMNITAFSIHDSIVTTTVDDLLTAEIAITDALKKYDLKPTFKKSGGGSLKQAA
ncbi:hypothetical protein [Mucilaginibacter rubeus]|uniref:DNA-directed DNA polymerase family A palm domain-containing protein n=1 Tax=Mucilaginibacter rubeus TaxID=2027860 RepID=A0A5C1HWG4_9SPHI|nr:hypothetical protein [Mucilaginibacter rubeus]QEM10194.1 hypothetical protein DEO27_009205 [Mucilaginibacter rubeus]